uniref:Uncharacterized protein n=1 Tax=Ascaris lumbricoides TaxID=6252 RepID=A0A0M3HVH9_ASCLU
MRQCVAGHQSQAISRRQPQQRRNHDTSATQHTSQ